MQVTVLLFAQARQIAGASEVSVNVESTPTVRDLRQQISKQFPQLAELLNRSSIAVNQSYAADDDVVPQGVEVAMIPPVSGG